MGGGEREAEGKKEHSNQTLEVQCTWGNSEKKDVKKQKKWKKNVVMRQRNISTYYIDPLYASSYIVKLSQWPLKISTIRQSTADKSSERSIEKQAKLTFF